MSRATARALDFEPDWPAAEGRRIVFLVDAASRLERRLLESWIMEYVRHVSVVECFRNHTEP